MEKLGNKQLNILLDNIISAGDKCYEGGTQQSRETEWEEGGVILGGVAREGLSEEMSLCRRRRDEGVWGRASQVEGTAFLVEGTASANTQRRNKVCVQGTA